jgi:hypothetical protein
MYYKILKTMLYYPLSKLYATTSKIPGLGNLILLALGAAIMSIGVGAFLLNRSSSVVVGVGGLSRIIEVHLSASETAGWLRVALNLDNISFALYWLISTIFLMLGALKNGEKEQFVLKSFAGVVLVSFVFLPMVRHFGLNTWSWSLPDTANWLALPLNALFGSTLLSIGISLTIAAGGSTCGPDLLGVLVRDFARNRVRGKYSEEKCGKIESLAMASTMRVFDSAVLVLGVFAFRPADTILYIASTALTILVLSSTVPALCKLSEHICLDMGNGNQTKGGSSAKFPKESPAFIGAEKAV